MIDWDYGSKGKLWSSAPARKQLTKPFKCVHAVGLPIAEGASCEIDMHPDKFVISSAGAVFELGKSKITGIERVTRKELTRVSKGSAGLAALGGLAFGAAGAVVGASDGKTKTLKRCERFAVFSYEGDEGLRTLVFGYEQSADQVGSGKQTLRKFIKDCEDGEGYKGVSTIEL